MKEQVLRVLEVAAQPLVNFFKERGIWDEMTVAGKWLWGATSQLHFWLTSSVVFGQIMNVITEGLKFVGQILLAIIDVIIDILQWCANALAGLLG